VNHRSLADCHVTVAPNSNLAAKNPYAMEVLVYEHAAIGAPPAIVVRWIERNPLGKIGIDVGVSHLDAFATGLANITVCC
jgi:hypothetical protein